MSKLTEEFLKWLPKHTALTILHNPHIEFGADVGEYVMREGMDFLWPDCDTEIEANVRGELWVMIFCPGDPPVHHEIAAPTLEKLLLFAHDPRFREDGNE